MNKMRRDLMNMLWQLITHNRNDKNANVVYEDSTTVILFLLDAIVPPPPPPPPPP